MTFTKKEHTYSYTDEATSEEIKQYARNELGMLTLKESCMLLIEQGVTTVEELVKVAYYD